MIEGRLSSASAKDELVKLATRPIVEEALEGEAGDSRADRARGRNVGKIEMKRLFLTGAALMLFGGSALAADIPRSTPDVLTAAATTTAAVLVAQREVYQAPVLARFDTPVARPLPRHG